MNSSPIGWPAISLLTLLVGVGLGSTWRGQQAPEASDYRTELRQVDNGYRFINPLLACDAADGRLNVEVKGIRPGVERVLEVAKKHGKINYAGVYFRDLNNGWWFGINENEKFRPASLLKVPLMMAYYKLAEKDPGILQKQVPFDHDYPQARLYNGAVPPRLTPEVGKSYTIEELIDFAIIYSDNQATGLLTDSIDPNVLHKAYTDLHIEDALDPTKDGLVTIRQYASFFRILFNGSYLDKDHSEAALQKLVSSEYKNGLMAGVPSNIMVANKFGESKTMEGDYQFHDCGIVYHESKPYLICVMTRGKDPSSLQSVIAEVSRVVYQSVDK